MLTHRNITFFCARVVRTYLGVDRKIWLPGVRWYDLADAILRSLRSNLLYICEGIAKLFNRWSICGRLLQSVRSYPLARVSASRGLSPPLDAGHIQRWGMHCAQGLRSSGGIIRISARRGFASNGGGIAVRSTGRRGSHDRARSRCAHRDLNHLVGVQERAGGVS